jgi:hypothetical protein
MYLYVLEDIIVFYLLLVLLLLHLLLLLLNLLRDPFPLNLCYFILSLVRMYH